MDPGGPQKSEKQVDESGDAFAPIGYCAALVGGPGDLSRWRGLGGPDYSIEDVARTVLRLHAEVKKRARTAGQEHSEADALMKAAAVAQHLGSGRVARVMSALARRNTARAAHAMAPTKRP